MKYAAVKIFQMLVVLMIVSMATVFMLNLVPGGPAAALLGDGATEESIAETNKLLGVDRSLPSQYFHWVGNAIQGDLGTSFQSRQPVRGEILDRLPVTLELAVLALGMALLIAIPTAMFSAYRADGKFDRTWSAITSLFISSPPFVIALIATFFLSVKLGIFPVVGWTDFTEDPLDNLRHAFLPAATLALTELAVFSRVLRADMIATLQNDYILAASAKGMTPRYVLWRHALRPSSFSLFTLAGLSLGRLIGGTVIVEFIFGLPGLGQLIVGSVTQADFPMVQGLVIFIAGAYVIINALVDVLHGYIDPRIRAAAS